MNTIFKVMTNTLTGKTTVASEAAKSKRVSASMITGFALAGVLLSSTAMATSLVTEEPNADTTSTTTNAAHDIFTDTAGNSSNLHAVAGKVIVIDDALSDIVKRQDSQDQRGNENSDRTYNATLLGSSAIHYDNDKVVKTDKDLTDTISGKVMTNRNGDTLKVRELQTDKTVPDTITFRGEEGTSLKNVAAGEVSTTSKDAVNGSQLKTVSDVANKTNVRIDNLSNDFVTNERYINDTNKSNQRISNLEGTRATKTELSLVQTQAQSGIKKGDAAQKTANANTTLIQSEVADRKAADESQQRQIDQKIDNGQYVADQQRQDDALSEETQERIKNDKVAEDKITDLYANKADKTDVNEVRDAAAKESGERIKNDAAINDRVDTTNNNLDKEAQARADADENQQRQIDTKADAHEVNEWLEIKADQASLEQTNVKVAGNTTAIANESGRAQAAEKVNADAAKNAQTSADNANVGVAKATQKAEGAQTTADEAKANVSRETERAQAVESGLESRKADRSEVKDVQDHQKVQDRAIVNAQSTGDAALTVGNAAYSQSQVNANDIQTLNGEVNRVDTRSAQRAQQAEHNANAYTDTKVAGLKQDIKKVDRDAKAGIAAAIALGQLQAPIHAGKGNVTVGAGNWKGQNAVSVGGGYRWNNDQWSAKGGVSFSDHGNALGGSVSYEFF